MSNIDKKEFDIKEEFCTAYLTDRIKHFINRYTLGLKIVKLNFLIHEARAVM